MLVDIIANISPYSNHPRDTWSSSIATTSRRGSRVIEESGEK
jgi:hypothetical protein